MMESAVSSLVANFVGGDNAVTQTPTDEDDTRSEHKDDDITQQQQEPQPSSKSSSPSSSPTREAPTITMTTTPSTTTTTTTSTEWLSANSNTKEWIDQWTRAGLSKYVSLPMICVLGDTSSGKSSVLSSLIGLELPSASTLTTKCPVLIQLLRSSDSNDDDEHAIVKIQWHDSNRKSSLQHAVSPRHRKRVLEEQHNNNNSSISPSNSNVSAHNGSHNGHHATNPPPPPPPPPVWKPQTIRGDLSKKIPAVLEKAQKRILDHRETLVAPDVICLTLYSPHVRDELTLVDLPGLVQFQHNQSASLLSQVEQVVLEYVHNPRSILLPVLAAPTNIFNSKVLQWTRTVDPTTRRTIPVLTKPDLIDPGSESDVLGLLQNDYSNNTGISKNDNGDNDASSSWQHGVYMVKNRGQALLDQGATIAEGLQEEADYFAATLPWSAMAEPRLGVPALRRTLAKVLGDVMKESLPDIVSEIQDHYDSTQSQLEAMGTIYQTKSEQRKYYHGLTQQLVNQVSGSLSGKTTRVTSLRSRTKSSPTKVASPTATVSGASQLHAACGEFFKTIQAGSLATISSLVEGATVIVTAHGSADDVKGELVHLDPQERFACVDYIDEKDHATDLLFDGIDYVDDRPDFEADEVWSDGTRVFIGRAGGRFDSMRKLPLKRLRTDPSWLVEKMEQFRTDDLACFVNVHMFQHIVADFVAEDWAPPCHELVHTLELLLTSTLDRALQEQLEGTRFPLLRNMVEGACRRVAKQLVENAKMQVKEHLELEEQHPYTQDQVLLQAMNESRLSSLQQDLELQLRLDQEGVVYDTQAIQTILDRVFQKHKRQNWMAEQMELVLSCYGKVATQRVLDRTPQICWQTYRSLPSALAEDLGCVTDEVLETCLWESTESRERFHALTNKLHELQMAMDGVQALRAKHVAGQRQ